MNIALCDDNKAFLQILLGTLKKIDNGEWIGQAVLFDNPKELLEADLSGTDILFLDMDMPEMSGIEAGMQIRKMQPALFIVIVSGFLQYSLEGYKIRAFRYLMKENLDETLPDCIHDIQRIRADQKQSIRLQIGGAATELPLYDILYLEGTSKRKVVFHTLESDYTVIGKLQDYDKDLRPYGFLYIQRSYIVNLRHVTAMRNYYTVLDNGQRLKISERKYPELKKQYMLWERQ